MTTQRFWLAVCAALAGLLSWLAFVWEPPASTTSVVAAPRPAVLPPGGDFTLTGPNGPVSLSDYRGKVVVLYFGYTFCPDVCPTALVAVAQAFATLTPVEANGVRGLFVSVDPERDTPEVLKTYAPFFHPAILGVSGSPEQLTDIARRYGVYYMKQKPVDGRPYTVDHTSYSYIIGPDGRLLHQLPHGTAATTLSTAIRNALQPSRDTP